MLLSPYIVTVNVVSLYNFLSDIQIFQLNILPSWSGIGVTSLIVEELGAKLTHK